MPIDVSLLINPTKYDQIDYVGNQHHILESAQNDTLRSLVTLLESTGPFSGTGSPEAVQTASPGALYTDITTPDTPSVWVKVTGTGNTGWRQLIA